jgi:hypothetical protein
MRLSKHFTRAEFEASQTAERKGIDNVMTLAAIQKAIDLCEAVLEPIREHFGKPVIITSGYRSDKLNKAIGGARRSQHSAGEAADIKVVGVSNWDVLKYIHDNLPYDQLICEFMEKGNPSKGWVHVSYRKVGNRRNALTINKAETTAGINFN